MILTHKNILTKSTTTNVVYLSITIVKPTIWSSSLKSWKLRQIKSDWETVRFYRRIHWFDIEINESTKNSTLKKYWKILHRLCRCLAGMVSRLCVDFILLVLLLLYSLMFAPWIIGDFVLDTTIVFWGPLQVDPLHITVWNLKRLKFMFYRNYHVTEHFGVVYIMTMKLRLSIHDRSLDTPMPLGKGRPMTPLATPWAYVYNLNIINYSKN